MAHDLRAGLIGAGVFGGYHAAKYADLADVRLVAVLDTHPERAGALAGHHDARAFVDLDAFLAAVDIVSIAAPATSHAKLALACLAAGKHVYVEKPLAVTLEEADAVAAAAARAGVVLACGFLERAALRAVGLMGVSTTPTRFEAWRHGPFSPRGRDVSVVLDLMIHDLDLALSLGVGEPVTVEAEGAGAPDDLADEVVAEVVFAGGAVGVFSASRIAAERRRQLRISYPSGEVAIDFLGSAFSNTTPLDLDASFAVTPQVRDRLSASLAQFLAAVRDRNIGPLADVAAGVRALDLALAVEQALGR